MPRGVSTDSVPVTEIRRAFLESGFTKSELARRMGWVREKPELKRVNVCLGLVNSGGTRPPQEYIGYEKAVEIVRALDLDPTEYGL